MDQVRSGGPSHHAGVTTMFRWAKSSLGPRLRCLGPSGGSEPPAVRMAPGKEPQALLGSALPLPNKAPAAQRRASPLLRRIGFDGAGGRGGERDLPRQVLSPLTTAQLIHIPLKKQLPRWPSRPRRHICSLDFVVAAVLPVLSPGTRNEPGRLGGLGSRPAPLLLWLGNPVKKWGKTNLVPQLPPH